MGLLRAHGNHIGPWPSRVCVCVHVCVCVCSYMCVCVCVFAVSSTCPGHGRQLPMEIHSTMLCESTSCKHTRSETCIVVVVVGVGVFIVYVVVLPEWYIWTSIGDLHLTSAYQSSYSKLIQHRFPTGYPLRVGVTALLGSKQTTPTNNRYCIADDANVGVVAGVAVVVAVGVVVIVCACVCMCVCVYVCVFGMWHHLPE